MSDAYEEVIAGEVAFRRSPSGDHEVLVGRLHALVRTALSPNSSLALLPPRTAVEIGGDTVLRPDLTVVRMAGGEAVEPYLVAEVLLPGDHHLDTFIKKQLWSDRRLARLWMIDPRYLNIEVYGCGPYGFTLQDILANHHALSDPHLPGLHCSMEEFFRPLARRT